MIDWLRVPILRLSVIRKSYYYGNNNINFRVLFTFFVDLYSSYLIKFG